MKTELLALIENYGKALVHQTEGKISAFKDAKNLMSNIVFMLDKAEQAQRAEYPPLPSPHFKQGANPSRGEVDCDCYTADQMRTYYGQGRIGRAPAPAAKCETCNDNGLIGGPSFYDPGEGGVPCPDCSAPAAVEPIFEGGRESVDDAIAVVESFGPGIEGLNDTFARQILLADEVKRLQRLYDSAVTGRADMRDALREARHGAQPVKLDFTKPLETDEGKPVKWIAADVIEYKCARVCVDVNTGLVYSSPYVGLKIRNATEAPAAVEPVEIDYPHEQMDALALARYKVLPSDQSMYWRHAVVAGEGLQHLYNGSEVDCQIMARKFAGAFLDGAFTFHQRYTAPRAQPSDALDAETVKKAKRYDWLRHGDNDEKVIMRGPVAHDFVYLPRNEKLDALIDAAMATQGAKS